MNFREKIIRILTKITIIKMSVFNNETIDACLSSCDERIEKIQENLSSWRLYGNIMNITGLKTESKYQDKLNNYENNIKLIQTEKLLYKALAKPNSNKESFTKILSKYDELMSYSYDISGNMVLTGLNEEGEHLKYCQQSLQQREYIKKLCDYGKKR